MSCGLDSDRCKGHTSEGSCGIAVLPSRVRRSTGNNRLRDLRSKLDEIHQTTPSRRSLSAGLLLYSNLTLRLPIQLDLREGKIGQRIPRVQRPQPLANSLAEWRYRYPCKGRRMRIDSPQCCTQQGRGSLSIAALKVMKRRRHLNQPLQECFLRVLQLQPHRFPVLMCGKELSGAVASQPLGKSSASPIEFLHQGIISKDCM